MVSRKATIMVSALSALIILMMFLFWRETWFGRQLTKSEISEYLADKEKPRRAQHALSQISDRINQGDRTVAHWYPSIVALADHPLAQLRVNVAWVMGQDNTEQLFHGTLQKMLTDVDPLVRRNAALSLIRFGDDSGHDEVLSMLQDYAVVSPHQGVLVNRLVEGNIVDVGTLLARVESKETDEELEIRSPVPGTVKERLLEDGATISVGTPVMSLSPEETHVFEALRGLYLIGTTADIATVRRFFRPPNGMSTGIAQQAQFVVEAIRNRAELENNTPPSPKNN